MLHPGCAYLMAGELRHAGIRTVTSRWVVELLDTVRVSVLIMP